MRFLVPAVHASLTLVAVAACFFPWGVTQHSWGGLSEKDGWRDGAPSMILFPVWVGDWNMPHFVVPIALGLAALASWGRATGYRVPAPSGVVLCGYAAYHTGVYLWFFASGKVDWLIGSTIQAAWPAAGVYLALAASLTGLVVSVIVWRRDGHPRSAPQP